MKKYRRINWTERLLIEKHYNSGRTYREIAAALCRSVSSVYGEIQGGLYDHLGAETTRRPRHYSADLAQARAAAESTAKGRPIKLGHRYDYAQEVSDRIAQGQSPAVIVHSMRKAQLWTVSTTTLYRYIDCGYIPGVTNASLLEKLSRKQHEKETVMASRAPKGASIDERPLSVSSRSEFGHWEMDSIVGTASGKRQSLLVLIERMTRFQLVLRAWAKDSASTVRMLNRFLPRFPAGTFRSLTVDNGSEFQDCYGMEHTLDHEQRLTVYYCHPYMATERGSNERANRILRRFFPKGRSLAKVTQKQCDTVSAWVNHLPRKMLGYACPHDLFQAEMHKLDPSFIVPSADF